MLILIHHEVWGRRSYDTVCHFHNFSFPRHSSSKPLLPDPASSNHCRRSFPLLCCPIGGLRFTCMFSVRKQRQRCCPAGPLCPRLKVEICTWNHSFGIPLCFCAQKRYLARHFLHLWDCPKMEICCGTAQRMTKHICELSHRGNTLTQC